MILNLASLGCFCLDQCIIWLILMCFFNFATKCIIFYFNISKRLFEMSVGSYRKGWLTRGVLKYLSNIDFAVYVFCVKVSIAPVSDAYTRAWPKLFSSPIFSNAQIQHNKGFLPHNQVKLPFAFCLQIVPNCVWVHKGILHFVQFTRLQLIPKCVHGLCQEVMLPGHDLS